VIDKGKVVWAQGYGLADRATARPVSEETLFNVGSVSKTVTAFGVMALVEAGAVELDAPVGRYLKRWRLPQSELDNNLVTVRRLLSHSSGLSVYPVGVSFNAYLPGEAMPTLEEELSRHFGNFGKLRLVRQPGTSFEYNNGNYAILELLVEEVTGERFANFMARRVFKPLGMNRSTYDWLPDRVAVPYREDGAPWPPYQFVARASGGLYTTAADLARLLAATMTSADDSNGSCVLRPETIEAMLTPALEAQGRYGLGFGILPESKGTRLVGHTGSNEGWKAMYLAEPSAEAGIVILSNSDRARRIMPAIILPWALWMGIDIRGLMSPGS
jgi:CubicO group peptidase (beta-lactamase class C family)